jgi:hypothetical protein
MAFALKIAKRRPGLCVGSLKKAPEIGGLEMEKRLSGVELFLVGLVLHVLDLFLLLLHFLLGSLHLLQPFLPF